MVHSNTTLVKVKFLKVDKSKLRENNSNTTLVKVKLIINLHYYIKSSIQIQHLLKLNRLVARVYLQTITNSNTTLVKVKC